MSSSLGPKPLTEAPPPTYEETLDRQTVRLTEIEEQAVQEEVTGADMARESQDNNTENVEGVSSEPQITNSENIDIEIGELERLEPTGDDQILPAGQVAAIADIKEEEAIREESIVTDKMTILN